MLIILEDFAKHNLRAAAELNSSLTSELATRFDTSVGYQK